MSLLVSKRLPWVTGLAIFISSFAVIYSSFTARTRFIEWQSLLNDARAYEIEWGQLLLEKSTMASYSRLEHVASDKLKMIEPKKAQIILVEVGQ